VNSDTKEAWLRGFLLWVGGLLLGALLGGWAEVAQICVTCVFGEIKRSNLRTLADLCTVPFVRDYAKRTSRIQITKLKPLSFGRR
jgi:hypothetical protein